MAQVTDAFKNVINDHLQAAAASDALFAETLKKPKKNIDDCATYIINEVKKSGKVGFADEEIFSMAKHYYDEDDIKPGATVSGTVVVNHHVEKTAKSVTAAPKEVAEKPAKKAEKQPVQAFASLFD